MGLVGSVGVAGATVGRIVMFGAVDVAGEPDAPPTDAGLRGMRGAELMPLQARLPS